MVVSAKPASNVWNSPCGVDGDKSDAARDVVVVVAPPRGRASAVAWDREANEDGRAKGVVVLLGNVAATVDGPLSWERGCRRWWWWWWCVRRIDAEDAPNIEVRAAKATTS